MWRALFLAIALLVCGVSDATAAAIAKLASYRELPYGACKFAVEQLHFQPDPWQEKVLVAFADPKQKRISLQACAGPGKSAIEVVCGWYFLATQASVAPGGHGYEHPNGFATSITGDNLRDNLWKEFAKWQARSDYLRTAFTWSANRIFANDYPSTWFLAARSWPKSGSADEQGRTFSGLHGRNVLVICDESGAIPPTVLRAAEQALANTRFGKILQAGNPISLDGMLYEAANRLRHQWLIISVTGDPDDPDAWVHSPRVANVEDGEETPADWARQQIATYSRDNAWVQAYILGKFPKSSLNSLLTLEEVEAAQQRHLDPDDWNWAQKRLGVDVARFGDDRSVILARQGLNAQVGANNPVVLRTGLTTDIAARVAMAISRWGAEMVFVDDTGHWGHGVIDNLTTAQLPAIGINFAGAALDPRYRNRRAEMWIGMADWVKAGGALPPMPELVAELTVPTYTFLNGTFQLEEKDQIKKRLGRSPDVADALALTFALPDMPGGVAAQLGAAGAVSVGRASVAANGTGRALTDYDPYGG